MFRYFLSHLHSQLVIGFVIVLLTQAAIMTFYNLYTNQQVILKAERENHLRLVQAKVTAAEMMLVSAQSDLLYLIEQPAFQRFVNRESSELAMPLYEAMVHRVQNFLSDSAARFDKVVMVDGHGRPLLSVVLRDDGQFQIDPPATMSNQDDTDAFVGATHLSAIRGSGVPVHISRVHKVPDDHGRGRACVFLSTVMWREDGMIAGVMILRMPLQSVFDFLADTYPGRKMLVLDREGRLIAHKGPWGQSDLPSVRAQSEDAGIILRQSSGTLVHTRACPDSLQVFARFRPIGQAAVHWTVWYELPIAPLFSRMRSQQWAIVLASVISMLVAGVVVVLMVVRLVRPLRQLSRAVETVGKDHWETSLPRDIYVQEVRQLTDVIERMSVRIGQQIEALECEIVERQKAQQDRERLIDELERRNAELERFTYSASHDLKTPLTTISGFIGFILRNAEAGKIDEVKADVQRVRDAASRMDQLLNDLLELSRIGRIVNDPQPVAFGEIVNDALAATRGDVMRYGARISVAEDLPVVEVDRTRLTEVMQNLLANAVKYASQQPVPQVRIGVRDDHGERIFYVADNGCGIAPAYHERVFVLFERLDSRFEGTGVGLALVRRIIEWHGGRVWVESEGEGRGATFCFTLGEVGAPVSS